MSYRELRDFTEHIRALGCPVHVSIDSFRQPNFTLVSALLVFLLRRYDPTVTVNEDISTQAARIAFIQQITVTLAEKCHIKLSMKQLYKADGYAVKEMIKLSTVLYKAVIHAHNKKDTQGQAAAAESSFSSSAALPPPSVEDWKEAKAVSMDIVDLGERLSSLLGKENEVRPHREQAVLFIDTLSSADQHGGSQQIERTIRQQLELIRTNLTELTQLTNSLNADADKMKDKVDKKSTEVERVNKRWAALRRVKPQFQAEYEASEKELRTVYSTYVLAMRNIQHLTHEHQQLIAEEQAERIEREKAMGKMQNRIREEERRILRGEGGGRDGGSDTETEDDEDEEDAQQDDDEDRAHRRHQAADQSESSDQSDDDRKERKQAGKGVKTNQQTRNNTSNKRNTESQHRHQQDDEDDDVDDLLNDDDDDQDEGDLAASSDEEEDDRRHPAAVSNTKQHQHQHHQSYSSEQKQRESASRSNKAGGSVNRHHPSSDSSSTAAAAARHHEESDSDNGAVGGDDDYF